MLYLLMFLQIGAMFYALRLHRRRQLFANMIPAAIAVHIFGIGVAFIAFLKIILIFSSPEGVDRQKMVEEANTEYVALWYLGRKLAQQYPGDTLLVVKAPDTSADFNQKNRIKGLEEGIGQGMKIVYADIEYLKPRKRQKRLPLYSSDKLNELLENNEGAKVVLSLIGLPDYYYEMPTWTKDFADFYAYRGNPLGLDRDIRDGVLKGYITFNPNEEFVGSKDNKAEKTAEFFKKYFIFVDENNVDDLVDKFDKIFKFPPRILIPK